MWPEIRLLDATLPTIAENLALDEALLVDAEDRGGPAVLRVWEPSTIAVVLGASGRILDDVRADDCRADGVDVARRSSGGGTVVVGPGTLNFALILPVEAAPELKAVDSAQAFVLGRTAESIRREGPAVEVLGSGDLALDRRKFAGSAQRRLRRHVLVHATILHAFPLDRIDRYTRMPTRTPEYRGGRAHPDFVVNLPLPRARLLAAIRSAWLPDDPSTVPIPADLVRSLVAEKFGDIRWIGRL